MSESGRPEPRKNTYLSGLIWAGSTAVIAHVLSWGTGMLAFPRVNVVATVIVLCAGLALGHFTRQSAKQEDDDAR